jgi:hypothetical protein
VNGSLILIQRGTPQTALKTDMMFLCWHTPSSRWVPNTVVTTLHRVGRSAGSEAASPVCARVFRECSVQYAAVARATDTVTNHRQGRPLQGAGESSSVRRAWWVYAIGRTLQALRRRRHQRSAAFLAQRALTKARYVQLYLAARMSPLDAKQSAEMMEVRSGGDRCACELLWGSCCVHCRGRALFV